MITLEELHGYLRSVLPDATVAVVDQAGTSDHLHLSIRVESDAFRGVGPLDRHRLVFKALGEPMADGRIHALEIETATRT